MELQQIQALIEATVEHLKIPDVEKGKKIPNLYDGYVKAVEMAEDTAVHAFGEMPDRLFELKRPNETSAQRAYRKSAMEAYTMPVWMRAVGAVQGRVWNDSNYSIEWTDPDHKKYFMEDYPEGGSIVQWFKTNRMPYKLHDPNAVMAIDLGKLPMKESEEGGETVMRVDDTKMLEPFAVIRPIKAVMSMSKTHALLLLDEKSPVMYGNQNRPTMEGLVFEFYTDTELWRIVQVGRKLDWVFEYEFVYAHNLGVLPVWRLGGVPLRGNKLYQSYFWPAVADLNTALDDEGNLNIAKIANIFPERWEVRSKCNASGCDGGKVLDPDRSIPGEAAVYMDCQTCNGTGNKPHTLNAFTINLPERLDMDGNSVPIPTPPLGYVEKETETVKFLREEITRKKSEAFANLNIDVASRPNGQTATESKIDREELFSLLLQIAGEEFEALTWAIWAIGVLRYGPTFADNMPAIDDPTNFTIRSYQELTEEIAKAREQKLPAVALRKLLEEYMAVRFSQDYRLAKLTDLVFYTDRLVMLSDQDVMQMVSAGLASKTEAVIHFSIYTLIEQAIAADPDFILMEIKEQADVIRGLAAAIVGGLGGQTVDEMLNELAVAEPVLNIS